MSEPQQSTTFTIGNMTVGNGALVCAYQRSNGICQIRFRFTLGSTSVMGTSPNMTVPFAGSNLQLDLDGKFIGELYDSAGTRRPCLCYTSGTTFVSFGFGSIVSAQVTALGVSAAAPFTWKATDLIKASWEYAMASIYS